MKRQQRNQGQQRKQGQNGQLGQQVRSKKGQADERLEGIPVAKNDVVTLEMVGMNHDGEGVGRVEGYTLFVQAALPGEVIQAKVLKTKKQYGYAKLLKIVEPSPQRVPAPCAIYDQCGGCQLQHLSYEGQLAWKRQHVVDALERIGKLHVAGEQKDSGLRDATTDGERAETKVSAVGKENEVSTAGKATESSWDGSDHSRFYSGDLPGATADSSSEGIRVLPTLGMEEPWRYRNKGQVPMGAADGGLVGGFYARGSHRIVDMETCLIQHEDNDAAVDVVKQLGSELGISAYNEETGRGLLRHVVVKKAFRTGEMMLVLVTNGRDIPHLDAWIGSIRDRLPDVVSICQNINTKRTNVIFGDETLVLWGRDVIYDYIGDVQFAISARSFYQVNPVQTEVLYRKTVEYAGLTGKETVIDAYCGIGTISLFLAQHAEQVYGVEIVKEAIEDARANAELNGMKHVKFEVGASEDVIPRWKEQGIEADVIVVDPPRKGCDPRLLDTILEMRPERVVYVSCNPATLARDLRVLEDGGYKAVEVQPVDMFPHTVHVESVALLVRDV
ncbi:hypothetical protein J41TS12_14370 [Paenibacillus antibioticophila]|uniref:TRAM domain-containing protein n=2 Tax=Paenibacillus antibioticophila TaxID=1274374 RepID=A0A919XP08_9BACL|nr:23S rRNA (uracil(1939)-C(5))-methyltransferase RlmD [Paenibacillus antibioticophila]GIO36576.1 hypothetical protein J41TS12_14370 [Paenibacillus antibioticophila]